MGIAWCSTCGEWHGLTSQWPPGCVVDWYGPPAEQTHDDAPTPDDAGLLASWSGHDWYADLGGESGHE